LDQAGDGQANDLAGDASAEVVDQFFGGRLDYRDALALVPATTGPPATATTDNLATVP